MVIKPDRLARSAAELLAIKRDLSKRKIGLVVLSMGDERLDTRNPTSKLMLTILASNLKAYSRHSTSYRTAVSVLSLSRRCATDPGIATGARPLSATIAYNGGRPCGRL
jgi:DNA invertase Pin-like site-specific DNA recombinase